MTTTAAIGLMAYPVGAVYISYVSTSPASLFGGTWVAMTGVFPYFNAGTGTGGSNTHTLTTAQMPAHNHGIQGYYLCTKTGGDAKVTAYEIISSDTASSSTPILSTGGGGSHNNMPAYQTLYAWRRTA